MSLITLLLLGAFSLLYVGKSLEKKPDFIAKAIVFLTENLEMLAVVGVIYGFLAAVLTPILSYYPPTYMFIRLIANIVLFMMALPFAYDKLTKQFEGKINAAILAELRNFVSWVTRNDKAIGYAGALFTFLMFAVTFH